MGIVKLGRIHHEQIEGQGAAVAYRPAPVLDREAKMKRSGYSRRLWLRNSAAAVGVTACGWLAPLADLMASQGRRKRHCVLLWMAGGPSQMDTFDMKPQHVNGGEFSEISTSVPGLKFSEHLPGLAKLADQLAVIRSLSTKEGDHGRGTYLMRTGHAPGTPVKYPTIGSSLSKQLGDDRAALPNYVAINQNIPFSADAFGPGFLGPRYSAATVNGVDAPADGSGGDPGFAQLRVENLTLPAGVSDNRASRRFELWEKMQQDFIATRPVPPVLAQDTIYRRAVRTMNSKEAEAFDLSKEPTAVREAYGRGTFGQGCLVARRLIECGVPFVEVSLGAGGLGWDTHANNFQTVRTLSEQLDAGWSTLMAELDDRGLLQDTTFLWVGEFGRTPAINDQGGRDHYPNAWTCVFAGGGIAGGQAYGKTSEDGREVEEGKVEVGDVLATLCQALGVDPATENVSPLGRPHKIAEGTAISDVLT